MRENRIDFIGVQGAFGDGNRRIRFVGREIEGENAVRELELWGIWVVV